MAQIRKGRDGKIHIIEADAGGVAEGLKRLDSRLHLRYSEKGDFYVVYCREEHEQEGTGHLVGTFQECDQRIVKSIEETMYKWKQPGFDFGKELEEMDDKAEKEADHASLEATGEYAERLAFALRKDLNLNNDQAFIGREVPSGNS